MEFKCQRCSYIWDYNGKSEWYTSCPRCRTSISIRKQMRNIKEEKKKDVIKSEINEKKEHPTPTKKIDVPTLILSKVRGI